MHRNNRYIGPEFTKILEKPEVEYRQANLTVACKCSRASNRSCLKIMILSQAAIQSAFDPPQGKSEFEYVFDFTGEVRNDRSELVGAAPEIHVESCSLFDVRSKSILRLRLLDC